jgi:hypothetical protein
MTSYLSKITACVVALAAVAAIGATSAMALGGPPGLRYSRGQALVTSVQSTPTPSSSTQINLPPIPGVKIETPATSVAAPVATQSTGFNWSDAAVGALTTAGVCIVLMGLALGLRRRHEPKTA